jgi:hypothetical protein
LEEVDCGAFSGRQPPDAPLLEEATLGAALRAGPAVEPALLLRVAGDGDSLLLCCMARCCSAKGTRWTAGGVLWLKKCTFSELRGALATERSVYRRFAALGATGNCPRTKLTSRI